MPNDNQWMAPLVRKVLRQCRTKEDLNELLATLEQHPKRAIQFSCKNLNDPDEPLEWELRRE